MNGFFAVAAGLCLITVAFHCVAGGARVVRPMLASGDLNQTVKAVLYGCWHAFTLLYLGVAAAFALAAFSPAEMVLAKAGATMAAMLAVLSALVIRQFGQRFTRLPHWFLFALTAFFGFLGIAA
ncbi:MAG: hypothetical protein HWE25_07830 [Alphaproteobacteria bacterium]|nr:hypothetical protein [Alphaproteobacteria bacterium]